MSKPTPANIEGSTLSKEIRESEPLFIDAATAAFRERVTAEYHRLRGYAIESGMNCIDLSVTVSFNFGEQRGVAVRSLPEFTPLPGASFKAIA